MKKRIYIYIGMFLSLTALFLWNCTDTIGFDFYGDRDPHDDFTIDEAKAFFEKQYSRNMSLSRSIEEKGTKRLTPGDFVPLWDKAVPSAKGRLECYDIPIKNDIHYKAIYSTYENGKARAYSVNVYQKLVVVKNKNNGNMGTYILNLIPDAGYDKKYLKKVGERFINCADKGGFSGIAFYTMPNLDMILRVNYYKDGVKTRGVFLAGKKEDMEEKMRIAYSIIDGVVVKGKKKVSTRSYGEDDWWDDGWWEDEDWDNWKDGGWESDSGFIEIGDSLWYVDENGNAFIMEDINGVLTPVTPDVVITPPEEDDDWWTPGEGTEEELPFLPGNEDPDGETDNGDGGYVPGDNNNSTNDKNKGDQEGDEQNKELNEKIESLNKNDDLKDKVKEIFDSFYQKSNSKENGWIRSGNVVHSPKDQESTSIKYDWSNIGKGITEWYHSHPTGAPIPSAADLSLLTSRYTGGYLDVDNFSYGVISEFGCTTFIITSEEDFKAFAESFSYDKMKEELNQFFLNNRGGAETIVSAFSDFLDSQNTGLELIFNPYDQSTNEWGGWKVL